MHCPNCGKEFSKKPVFCPECELPLPKKESSCVYLGTRVQKNELSQAEKDSLEAKYEQAENVFYGSGVEQNKEIAIKLYTELAKADHAKSQFTLGNIYKVSGNFDEAIKWYKMCAEQGWVAAVFKIGETYQDAGNIEEAIANLKQAADLGNGKAKLALKKLEIE